MTASTRPVLVGHRAGVQVDPLPCRGVERGHGDERGDRVVAGDIVVGREVVDVDDRDRLPVAQGAAPLATQAQGVVPGDRDADGDTECLHHDLR